MAVRLLKYFLLFFVLIMVFLLSKNPYSLEYNSDVGNRAEIEIFDMKNYEISVDGVLSVIIAKKVERYSGYDKMYEIEALHVGRSNLIDSLSARKALFAKNILYLDDDVKYTRSDDLTLDSQSIKYDVKNKVLSSNMPFKFTRREMVTNGNSFVYDLKGGVIRADKIKTVIRMDKK